MSVEDAKKFIQEAIGNDELRKALADAPSREARKKIAEDRGFSFTSEEFQTAREETLSDEDLDSVSGGGHCGYTHEGEHGCGDSSYTGDFY